MTPSGAVGLPLVRRYRRRRGQRCRRFKPHRFANHGHDQTVGLQQALAVKKTDLNQQCTGHARRGKAALAAGNQLVARGHALRQRMAMQHVAKLDALQLNLERIYGELDVLHTVAHAHQALSSSSVALEQTLKELDLGRVTELLDTIDDQLKRGQEVGEALALPLAPSAPLRGAEGAEDDDAIAAVLEEWCKAPPVPPPPQAGGANDLRPPVTLPPPPPAAAEKGEGRVAISYF